MSSLTFKKQIVANMNPHPKNKFWGKAKSSLNLALHNQKFVFPIRLFLRRLQMDPVSIAAIFS